MKNLHEPVAAMPPPTKSAKLAGLRYVTDDKPGIRRERRGKEFLYRTPENRVVRERNELARIKRLAIPPAWEEVWISPFENGHLQATGRDVKGRKQYRYHNDWRSTRDEDKFGRMMAFGRALPKIRKRLEKDLAASGLPRHKVLATIVRLLETTCIRVGNDEYARDNKSYGLTTMKDRHARIHGDTVTFDFKGKSGKHHKIDVRDRKLARIVKRCQDLPDQELFAYINEQGMAQDVKSQDVNEYLREISGQEFTAKDFRTWAGTVLAAIALREFEQFASATEAKRNINKAIEAVAKLLGNTPAVCRKCYVHPRILESYLDGITIATLKQRAEQKLAHSLHTLKPEEAAVLGLLQQKFAPVPQNRSARVRAKDLAANRQTKIPKSWRLPRK